MLKRCGLLVALLLLAGCQIYETPAYVTSPPIVGYDRERPLPPAPYVVRIEPDTRRGYLPPRYNPPRPRPPYARVTPPQPAPTPPAAAIPRGWRIAPDHAHAWRWIVIHHSDTTVGSATSFDRYHRLVHHWDELGYHFVIGNGAGSGNGQVEVGPRWTKQKWGAHAGVAVYNEYGIGICLVGNFNSTHPTPAQMRSLAQLTGYLMHTYHIPADHVIGHRDAKHTDCPGRNLDVASVRRMAASYAQALPAPARLARR